MNTLQEAIQHEVNTLPLMSQKEVLDFVIRQHKTGQKS